MNYYDVLGVPRDATPEQIRTAYRALVQLFHPDRLRHLRPDVAGELRGRGQLGQRAERAMRLT